jgi:hypothetical protein
MPPGPASGMTVRRSLIRSIVVACVGASIACDPGNPSPPASTADVQVDFAGILAGNRPLLLYSGRAGSACVSFEPHIANPSVTLNGVSYDPACTVELDAFAPELGSFARTIDPAEPGDSDWLVNAITSGTMTIAMPPLTPVPLRIWLVAAAVADVDKAKAMRDRLLDKAYPIFETMATGLTFDTASTGLNPTLVPVKCSDANAIATNPAIYDATRINVYFIKDYAGITDLTPAQTCWMQGHPEIVFISWNNSNVVDPTLAHEMGHSLGLVHPNALGGHTYLEPGFDAFNLMATNTDVTNASLGQLYALNYSSDSWLNRTGSPFVRPIIRSCQDSWGAGACPALTLFQPGWPP